VHLSPIADSVRVQSELHADDGDRCSDAASVRCHDAHGIPDGVVAANEGAVGQTSSSPLWHQVDSEIYVRKRQGIAMESGSILERYVIQPTNCFESRELDQRRGVFESDARCSSDKQCSTLTTGENFAIQTVGNLPVSQHHRSRGNGAKPAVGCFQSSCDRHVSRHYSSPTHQRDSAFQPLLSKTRRESSMPDAERCDEGSYTSQRRAEENVNYHHAMERGSKLLTSRRHERNGSDRRRLVSSDESVSDAERRRPLHQNEYIVDGHLRCTHETRMYESPDDEEERSVDQRRHNAHRESATRRAHHKENQIERRSTSIRYAAGGDGSDPSSNGNSDDEGRRSSMNNRRRSDRDRERSRENGVTTTRDTVSGVRCEHNAPRRWMKPDKFDGKTSLETFIYQFENCSAYNHWSMDDKAAHLRWSLSGIAAQLLWGTEDLSYDELMGKLRARFGGAGMEEKFQNELRCRRRGKGEPLRELAQDIRKLMMLAYPGEKSKLAEHIARDAFLTALDNPEFELKIREREPEDLDQAVKLALRFEVFKQAVDSSPTPHRRMNRHVKEEASDAVTQTKLESRLAELERRLLKSSQSVGHPHDASAQNGNNNNRSKQNRAVTDPNRRDVDQMANRIRELETACRSAEDHAQLIAAEKEELSKEVGRLRHLDQLRSSPLQPENRTYPVTTRAGNCQDRQIRRGTGACFQCGQQGHLAKSCPQRSAPVGNTAVTTTPQISEPLQPLAANGITRFGETLKDRSAYLRGIVNGLKTDCLLDTGSEISLLPASMVSPGQLRNTLQTLSAANGTSIPVLGEAIVPIKLGNFSTTVKGLVSAHIVEVMLGIDWLTASAAVWDFGKGCINFWERGSSVAWKKR
jgi:hypothetical protein